MKPMAIIAAAGHQLRWNNYNGIPKQLALIDGEPLIHRAIRQIHQLANIDDIKVLGTDKRFAVYKAVLHMPTEPSALHGTAIGHSVQAWEPGRDIFILMGDVLWTDEWMKYMGMMKRVDVTFFGNSEPTKDKNPEIMGVYVPAEKQDWFKEKIVFVRTHEIPRISGGWQVYRACHDLPLGTHEMAGGFVDVPDGCEDIDRPADWVRRKNRVAMSHKKIPVLLRKQGR